MDYNPCFRRYTCRPWFGSATIIYCFLTVLVFPLPYFSSIASANDWRHTELSHAEAQGQNHLPCPLGCLSPASVFDPFSLDHLEPKLTSLPLISMTQNLHEAVINYGLKRQKRSKAVKHSFSEFAFSVEPQSSTVPRHGTAIFHCSVSAQFSEVAKLEWRKDERQLLLDGERRSVHSNGSLVIKNAILSDATSSGNLEESDFGHYQCIATIEGLGTFVSRKARLLVSALKAVSVEIDELSVDIDTVVFLRCPVTSFLPLMVKWFKDGVEVIPETAGNGRTTVIPLSGSLEIKDVSMEDQGRYLCKANVRELDSSSSVSADVVRLVVRQREVLPEPVEPQFVARPHVSTAVEGKSLTLECAAAGFPEPKIQWLKDQSLLDFRNNERMRVAGQGSLVIERLLPGDAGLYTCRATNSEDSADCNAAVSVEVAPVIVKKPQLLVGQETDDVEFACEATGIPKPQLTWLRNGERLTSSEYFKIDGNKLKILGLVTSDSGILQCLAENSAGSEQAAAQLIVERSAEGSGADWSATPAVPSEPLDVRAVLVQSREVTLEWDPPTKPNGVITKYSVFYKTEGSSRERVYNSSSASVDELTIRQLQPRTPYHFRVVASSREGMGLSSSPLKITTRAEQSALPGKVRHLKASATGATSIEVIWDPPEVDSAEIRMYKLYYVRIYDQEKEDSNNAADEDELKIGDEETEIQVTLPSYHFDGLEPYTLYAFRVEAVSRHGIGASSEIVETRTFSDVPSSTPVNLTVDALSLTSAIIGWQSPHKKNGIITGYKIRIRARGRSTAGKTLTTEGMAKSQTVTGLTPGTVYTVKIAAMTVNGTGPYTHVVTVRTLDQDLDESQVPGAPLQLKVQPRNRAILVTWIPPEDDDIAIRGYLIGWGIGFPDVQTARLDGSKRSYTIENLKPNKEYVISLRAFNKLGQGFPAYETVRTLDTAPADTQNTTPLETPIGLRAVTVSSSSILVSWVDRDLPPSVDGYPQKSIDNRIYTIRYTTQSHVTHGRFRYANTSETACTVDGLKPHTQYEFAVKVTKGKRESAWSMAALNGTFVAAPSSPPRDLTIVHMDNNPSAVILNWQPPKQANGPITGYMVFYTNDQQKHEREWKTETMPGDRLTTTVENLLPDTVYYFRLQSRNDKGYGPISSYQQFRTAPSSLPHDSKQKSKSGPRLNQPPSVDGEAKTGQDWFSENLLMISIAAGAGSLVFIAVLVAGVCLYRTRGRRRDGYQAGVKKPQQPKETMPPDLWINHEHALRNRQNNPPDSNMGSIQDLKIIHDPTPPPFEMQSRFDLPTGGRTSQNTDSSGYGSTTMDFRGSNRPKPIGMASPRTYTQSISEGCGSADESFSSGTLSRNFLKMNSNPDTHFPRPMHQMQPSYGTAIYTGPKYQINNNIDQNSPMGRSPFGSSNIFGHGTPPPPQIPLPCAGSSGVPSRSESSASSDPPQRIASLCQQNQHSNSRDVNGLLSSFILTNPPPPPPPNLLNRKPSGLVMGSSRSIRSPLSVNSPRIPMSSGALSDSNYSSGTDTDTMMKCANSTEELNEHFQNALQVIKDLSSLSPGSQYVS